MVDRPTLRWHLSLGHSSAVFADRCPGDTMRPFAGVRRPTVGRQRCLRITPWQGSDCRD
jgi:hypothetical protein